MFGRRKTAQLTGRQRLSSDDLAPPPPAFAYRSRRSEEARSIDRQAHQEPSVNARSRPHPRLERLGLLILIIALAASVVNVLTVSNDPKLVFIDDSSSQALLRPAAVYQQAATQELKSSVWNANKITIDTNKLSQSLLRQFPELSSVSVTMPLLAHRPTVYIEPDRPALTLNAANGSFVLDGDGKVLLAASGQTAPQQADKLPVVTDQGNIGVQLDRQALSADNVNFIQTVFGELAAKQYAVSAMDLPPGGSELDVHLQGQPYFVKFNLESKDPKGESGTFLATIHQLQQQHITPGQYVDVRVPGRAYYK